MALYPRIPFNTLVNYQPDILDGFYYPAGAPAGSLDDFLSYFQLEYGEMTPIYQEPSLLKEHIRVVGLAVKPTLDAWAEALAIDYAPLENYDRTESGGETTNFGKINTLTGGNTTTHGKGNTITGGHKDAWPAHNIERKVAADNTATYHEAEKTLEDAHDITRTYQSEKNQESGTTKLEYDSQKDAESGKTTITRNSRIHGNIGVTTSQQMLQSELDLRRFDFMTEAGRLYAEKLLIMLY